MFKVEYRHFRLHLDTKSHLYHLPCIPTRTFMSLKKKRKQKKNFFHPIIEEKFDHFTPNL